MTCEQLRDLMPQYLLGALDASEQAAVRSHLESGCPACAGALAEAQATLAVLPHALPRAEPSPELRDRLMATIQAIRPARDDARAAAEPSIAIQPPLRLPSAASASRRMSPLSALALAAGIAGLIVSGFFYFTAHRGEQRRVNELQAAVRERDSRLSELESLLASAQVRVVAMGTGGTQQPGQPAGRVFWDRARQQWHLYVFDLKPPPTGRTYELWFITRSGEKLAAGTFNVDASGKGQLTVPVPARDITVAAITDEPPGGSVQPTGSIHLKGEVQ